MRLSRVCIERPVFASVLCLALLVFGWIGYSHIETRYFPQVAEPFATVSVSYPGASPNVMESEVTRYLENALININGLQNMHSRSTYHHSYVYLRFAPGTNLIKAMGDVRDAVSSVRDKMPTDADPPSISSGGVSRPVLNIGFMDDKLTAAQIRDYVTQVITPVLEKIPGMGGVWTYGASDYAMRIWLEPQKMAALGVTVTDVKNALQSNNIDFSGGSIRGLNRRHSLVADTQLHSAKQFAQLIVRDTSGQIVRLKDVADVELGSRSLEDSPMRIDGKPGIDLELRPLDSANPITVAKLAKQTLQSLQKRLPKGMSMKITYDQSIFLKGAINESFMTLLEAVLLVMVVVYLFLGTIRAALIPIITIPVCVVAVFGVMLLFGFSINIMTLLGLILAIGLVVDDAIVVLENIHRHIEENHLNAFRAALVGTQEIGFSIIAMTLTLAAVYAPVGFMSGFSAAVFKEFAFTLAGAVLISGFVALTLSPMMCSKILKPHGKASRYEGFLEAFFAVLNQRYYHLLRQVIKARWLVVGVLLAIAVIGYGIYYVLPQSFIPKEDIGYFTVNIHPPPGASTQYTDEFMKQFEKVYAKTPQILSYASFIFAGSATNFVTMQPWGKRHLSTDQVLMKINPELESIPVKSSISVPDPVNYSPEIGGSEIQVHIMTLGDYKSLNTTIEKLETIFKKYPGMRDVNTNLRFDNEVYEVSFRRDQAAALGVNLQDIADTISTLMAGKHITDVQRDGQTYEVLVQMNMKDLSSFSGLDNIYVRSQQGNMVPLSNLISFKRAVRQSNLYHNNRMRSADITANLAPHYDLGTVVKYIRSVLDKNLSPVEQYDWGGRIRAFLDASGTMFGLFALSILFIYLVLAAQFESFVDPFIILLTVPLCIVGAMATLEMTGGSLNLFTNIGLITLVGLISKHGILITQFANVRLQAGDTLLEAITSAAVTRLRPILMTTFAMVLGAVPLALAAGPGSISHQQIGWVIVGGMTLGTLFSLLVVPVAYYILAPFDHKKNRYLNELVQASPGS
jgi:multidrug efflux pump